MLLFAMAFSFAFAQQPFVVLSGHVVNQMNGQPVAGQIMYISVDSMNTPGYYNQVLTDEAGFYTDQIPAYPGVTQGIIVVYTADCNGMMASGTAAFYPGVWEVTIDFSICGDPAWGCSAMFRVEPASNDYLSFSFIDESFPMPGGTIDSWFWEFGDGNTSSGQNPVHTYSEPGLYYACLYVSSSDSSCNSSFCMPVNAGSTNPGGCENYFWYWPDSTGTGITFEGWVMNGEAISWLWDFGDGTTANGQTVNHQFADTNMVHTVCLTTTSILNGVVCTAVSCQEVFMYIPSPCESYFWYSPDSTGTGYSFEGWSYNGQVDSWNWDFGDGTTATGQYVSHTFTSPNDIYTVCLTTTGTGPDGESCTYTSCQDVYIYIPSPCESYFWYYPDSTGTGYTFEGWAMNNEITSWNWDFGDGTTASGQFVTHTFTDPAQVYTVCLTSTGVGPDGVACSYVSCQEVIIYIPSPCENYFTATTNDGNTYYFEGFLMSGMASEYWWDFGDGSTASGQQVTHTFQNGNGTVYNVCLTTVSINPADSCSSVSCQPIFPGSGGGCKATMSAMPDSTGYTFYFTDLSMGDYSFRLWDFGDGEQSTLADPVHTYASPGIYMACLTISDSLNNCWGQTCEEIWVNTIQPDCQASFFAFPSDSTTSSLSYQFINTSTPGYSNQQWSFGDGTGSTDDNPVHTYAYPGIYNACLTIWDSAGVCQSTYCMGIHAGEYAGYYTVSGLVIVGNTLATQGFVWLIGANNYYYAETMIDSTGNYNFGGVPAGPYYIYAMLTPEDPSFFSYLPTYYTSSLTWQGATIVTAGEPNGWYPINLVSATNWAQGTASISGIINWAGTFKSGGTPAANVEIILFNSSGFPIAYAFSNNDGTFAFNNLPFGEYTVHAEMAGKTTQVMVVILSDGAANASVNFEVTATEINAALGNDDKAKPSLEAGNVYPNPVGETLYLELNASLNGTAVAEIIDLQGRVITSERITISGGNNRINLSSGNLVKGIYLLRVSSEGYQPVQRKFIK
jgi:PKD repeat protein